MPRSWFMCSLEVVPIEVIRQGIVQIINSHVVEKTETIILISLVANSYDCRVLNTRCLNGIPSVELRMLPSAVKKDRGKSAPMLNHGIDPKVLTVINFPTLKYWQIFCASQTMFTVNVCFRPLGWLGRVIAEAG